MNDQNAIAVAALATCMLVGAGGDATGALRLLSEMEPSRACDLATAGIRMGADALAANVAMRAKEKGAA